MNQPPRRSACSGFLHALIAALLLIAGFAFPQTADAASLTPSRPGLMRQVRSARAHDYTYLKNEQQVRDFVNKGYLVRVPGNRDYALKPGVPFPYARPEVKLFLERLGDQYRAACGEKLVVTSLTRPKNRQPRNSSPLSVHPTGMAMDLRISQRRSCVRWIERALVNLEARGVLEAARERRPPHYHVVLFPRQYADYVHGKGIQVAQDLGPREAVSSRKYRVRSGDSLWTIARRHGTTVAKIQNLNGIRSNKLKPGQVLAIPAD
jgi:hypothetical protein